MSQQPETPTPAKNGLTAHRRFANYYERTSSDKMEESFMRPLRQEVIGQTRGRVLEIGAGNGLNFAFYHPDKVESVEAIEPDSAMLEYARKRAKAAPVPINLIQAPVENLPFADESFDSVVATLVFCSVNYPQQGMNEVRRVLKPGGALLMVEHVRSQRAIFAAMQTMITPFTRLMIGNCHWNRDTERTAIAAGFTIEQRRNLLGFVMPFVVLRAVK